MSRVNLFVTGVDLQGRTSFIKACFGALDDQGVPFMAKGRLLCTIHVHNVESVEEIADPNYVLLLESRAFPIDPNLDIPYKYSIQDLDKVDAEHMLETIMSSLGYI